jgi:tRNA(adenine34) deaminase
MTELITTSVDDAHWMRVALQQAQQAAMLGEVPVGAVLVRDNELIGAGFNCPISSHDPTAHAEIVALRAAALSDHNYRLPGTTLYVTIEPCSMCVGAIIHARVERVVFGAPEPRAGAVVSTQQLLDADHYNHRVNYAGGVLAEECAGIMQKFFRERRSKG